MSSLERTAAALLLPGFAGTTAPRWVLERIGAGLGGVTLYGRNVGDGPGLAALNAALHADSDSVVVSLDEEGGDFALQIGLDEGHSEGSSPARKEGSV